MISNFNGNPRVEKLTLKVNRSIQEPKTLKTIR